MLYLTQAHRERYLNALETIYTTTDTAGKARYGESFRSAHYFGALHNSVDYCFHGNLAFLTAHPAFALEVRQLIVRERPSVNSRRNSLSSVAPRQGIAYGCVYPPPRACAV